VRRGESSGTNTSTEAHVAMTGPGREGVGKPYWIGWRLLQGSQGIPSYPCISGGFDGRADPREDHAGALRDCEPPATLPWEPRIYARL